MLHTFATPVALALLGLAQTTPPAAPAGLSAAFPVSPQDGLQAGDDGAMDWTGVLDEASFAALHDLTDAEAPELTGESIKVGGMDCYLSKPAIGESLGAVIVIHEWWGQTDHIKHWTDRLASDGYTALAIDLYGGVVATDREGAMKAMRSVDQDTAIEQLLAAHEYLSDPAGAVKAERTACIGWCFGGGWSLQLAMAEPELDAAVVYYGRLVTEPKELKGINASMLGVFGNQDGSIPPAAVAGFKDAMKTAGKELRLRQYDAEHAFANPSSGRYDAENAAKAWRETRMFLVEKLWPARPEGSIAGKTRDLEFRAPEGWEPMKVGAFSTAAFQVGANSKCTVTFLGGEGGGVLPNLNRWNQQM
ncbi:MAG: carboxymethylenebutenolidase, partial [Planctomycetota bacterium]